MILDAEGDGYYNVNRAAGWEAAPDGGFVE